MISLGYVLTAYEYQAILLVALNVAKSASSVYKQLSLVDADNNFLQKNCTCPFFIQIYSKCSNFYLPTFTYIYIDIQVT